MTELLSRVAGFFYMPAAGAEASRSVARRHTTVAPSIAVLAPARDVLAAGGAIALAVSRERGSATGVVCVWTGAAERAWRPQAPVRPATRRLAGALSRRGHCVSASGRLVNVWLGADEADAAAEAGRIVAACGSVPMVVAIGGARGAHFDRVLAGCDLAVLATPAGADPALAPLALAAAASVGVPVVACEIPGSPLARLLASGGARLPRPLRTALRPAVEALS